MTKEFNPGFLLPISNALITPDDIPVSSIASVILRPFLVLASLIRFPIAVKSRLFFSVGVNSYTHSQLLALKENLFISLGLSVLLNQFVPTQGADISLQIPFHFELFIIKIGIDSIFKKHRYYFSLIPSTYSVRPSHRLFLFLLLHRPAFTPFSSALPRLGDKDEHGGG